jgi:thioesterase domain-containing protein
LAVEVAKQLVGHDKLVPFVGVIDTTPGPACFARTQLIHHLAGNVGPWALNFASWALKVMTREITEARHWVTVRNVILRKFRGQQKMHHLMRNDWYKNLPEGRKNIVAQNLLHARKYRFEGIYRGTISLFRQRPSAPPFDRLFRPHQLDDYGWRGVTRANVQVVYICGDHSSCMVPPDVVHLANELSLALDVAIAAPEAERAL